MLSGPPLFGDPKANRWKKQLGCLEMFFAKPRNAEVEPLGFHRDCTGRHGGLIHPHFYVEVMIGG